MIMPYLNYGCDDEYGTNENQCADRRQDVADDICREDEYLYREAGKLLSDKIRVYRENYQELGSIDHWTMVAFEMAFQTVKNREEERNNGFRSGIAELDKELDAYLKK